MLGLSVLVLFHFCTPSVPVMHLVEMETKRLISHDITSQKQLQARSMAVKKTGKNI